MSPIVIPEDTIENYKLLIENSVIEADRIVKEFIEIMQKKILEWYPNFIEQTVKNQPDITKSLGVEGVRNIKKEIPSFAEKLSLMIETEFQDNCYWSHRPQSGVLAESFSLLYKDDPIKLESSVYERLFPRINKNKPLIPNHFRLGYTKIQDVIKAYLTEKGYKFQQTEPTEKSAADLRFPLEVNELLSQYYENHNMKIKVLRALNKKEMQEKRNQEVSEAASIWDEA